MIQSYGELKEMLVDNEDLKPSSLVHLFNPIFMYLSNKLFIPNINSHSHSF